MIWFIFVKGHSGLWEENIEAEVPLLSFRKEMLHELVVVVEI